MHGGIMDIIYYKYRRIGETQQQSVPDILLLRFFFIFAN